jgi:GNAT superfamily N-acetyltransferase
MVTVRLATPDDATAIAQVFCSDVDKWFRWAPEGPGPQASYEELTQKDRWFNGGPWIDPGICRIHLEQALASGALPLVVQESGQILGEMEVIMGPDTVWGKVAHIDVLQVARGAQRKGMGRALVMAGLSRAIQSGCDLYTTNPAEAAVGFYAKCGMVNPIAGQREFTLPVDVSFSKDASKVVPGPIASFEPLRSMRLLFGRFQTSYAEWIKGQWSLAEMAGFPVLLEEGFVPDLSAYYRLAHWPPRTSSASLKGWVSDRTKLQELLITCAGRARDLGCDAIITTVGVNEAAHFENMYGTFGKESVLLGRSLKPAQAKIT